MKARIILLLLVVSSFFFNCKTGKVTIPLDANTTLNKPIEDLINGKWQGTLAQLDIAITYEVEIYIDSKKEEYRTYYPGSEGFEEDCTAVLNLERIEDNVYHFREKITSGLEQCYTNGKVTLEIKKNVIIYKCFWPNDSELNVIGVLYK